MSTVLEVVAPGPHASVQDAGRVGWTALGVPRSGAFDLPALRLANRLVGNHPDAAAVEFVLGGLHLHAARAVTVALTGARCPGLDHGAAVTLRAGAEFALGPPRTGLRCYLAVRGGIDADPVLGSAATDSLSGIGPDPLAAGDRIAVGDRVTGPVSDAFAPSAAYPGDLLLRWGPRDDWFTAAARDAFLSTEWQVRSESDRVGVRLDGPALERAVDGELPSEPVLPGAVQVPPDGRPIVFGPDAPVTGGYPVIGVVANLHAAAQLRPGDPVRFGLVR